MSHFLTLGQQHEFPEGRMRAFRLAGREIAVVRHKGRLYAFDNICTHRQEYLSDGFVIDGQVICALHEATYDLSSGAILYGPAFEPLPVFSIKVEGEAVQVAWPEPVRAEDIILVDHEDADRTYPI